jgi:hypothetical protein
VEFFIGFIIFFLLICVSLIASVIIGKRYINLFDENAIEKLKKYNYKLLEIKRKRRSSGSGRFNVSIPYNEYPLETEYSIPWSIISPEDIIEIYGIENNNKYLLYKMNWSKDNAQKVKNIVNKLNDEINSESI